MAGGRAGQSAVLAALGGHAYELALKRDAEPWAGRHGGGKLTNAKWAAMGKCSADTALRDINDLLARGVLRKLEGGGRSTGYLLVK